MEWDEIIKEYDAIFQKIEDELKKTTSENYATVYQIVIACYQVLATLDKMVDEWN